MKPSGGREPFGHPHESTMPGQDPWSGQTSWPGQAPVHGQAPWQAPGHGQAPWSGQAPWQVQAPSPGRRPWTSACWDVAATTAVAVLALLVAVLLASVLIDDAGNLRFEPNRGPDGASGAAMTATPLALLVGAVVQWPYRRWRNGRSWYEGRGDARSMGLGACLLVDLVQVALLALPPAVVLLSVDVTRHREVGLTAIMVATWLLAVRAVTAHSWAGEATARPGDPRPLADRSRGAKVARIALAWLTAPAGPVLGLLTFQETDFILAGTIVVAVLVPPISVLWWFRTRTPRTAGRGHRPGRS